MSKFIYKNMTPFKWFVLENFPFIENDFEEINNYRLFSKVVEYLNKMKDNVNNFGQLIEEFSNYFDNLDVQEEINNKLDEMVEDGTLTNLIGSYVNNYVKPSIDNLQSQITGLASGSPLVASSTSEMTDTTRVYVNTSNGHWYYYDGTNWQDGGVYQATEDSQTVSELQRLQENTIENIENYVENNNFIKWQIGRLQDGELVSASDRIVTPDIQHNIYPITVKMNDYSKFRFSVDFHDSEGNYLNWSGWQYNDFVIPANSYYRIQAIRFSSYEDLRPIGVYNCDVYQSLQLINKYNLSLLVDLSSNKYKKSNPILKKYIDYTTGVAIQGLTKVNDELWQFSASSADHTTYYGQILQIDENKNVTIKYHDFGHIPCVNYIKNKDMLIFGNAGDNGVTPVLQFYRNVSQHTNNIFSVNDENYSEIDLASIGTSVNISIGESDNIVYLFTANKIVKCLIGYGQNDFSSDIGTYNYIDDNTINGTLKILEEYNLSGKLNDITSVIQCELYLNNGKFAYLVGVNTSHLYIYSFNSENDFVLEEILDLRDMNNDGNYQSAEPEGLYQNENNKIYVSYNLTGTIRINELNI